MKARARKTPTPVEATRSQQLHHEATKVLAGGVSRNANYRYPHPDYVLHGEGCRVTDVDGNTRIDLANNTASLIHGHAHPEITRVVTEQLQRGTAFNLASEAELRFAQHLCARNPSFEKIRFMNSGTEAVMAAIKVSRAITGRAKIAKVEGTYHGTYDYAEISQQSAPENWGAEDEPRSVPAATGTPGSVLSDVVVLPFNEVNQTIEILDRYANELACVLLDPLPHRVGLLPVDGEYLAAIRKWATERRVLLVFDEVISFRMKYGGAQQWHPDVQPDLTALGKIIGGGFPVGALAGLDQHMEVLDPSNGRVPIPFSGTFSANPITMVAGLAAMEMFNEQAVEDLNQLGHYARQALSNAIASTDVAACVTGAGSMLRVHFRRHPPTNYRDAWQDQDHRRKTSSLVSYLYDHGFMMINTCTAALSTAVSKVEIDQFVEVFTEGLRQVDCC